MSELDPVEELVVQNVVASADLGHELDLEALSMDLTGTDYNPDNFPGIVYRMSDPKAAALIFRSGKLVCTGAKSVGAVETALTHVVDELEALGLPLSDDFDYTVQNIVSNSDLGTSLNLNALAIGLGLEAVEYEPEQFPGLVYRLSDPEVVILLFGSGKLVITGASTVEDAETAARRVRDDIAELGLV